MGSEVGYGLRKPLAAEDMGYMLGVCLEIEIISEHPTLTSALTSQSGYCTSPRPGSNLQTMLALFCEGIELLHQRPVGLSTALFISKKLFVPEVVFTTLLVSESNETSFVNSSQNPAQI